MNTARNYIFARKYGAGFLPNLVGYYPFNANANDFSGKGYHGTLVGTPTFTAGKVGNALDTIASHTNYVDIPDNNDFSFTNGTNDVPFSISCWIFRAGASSIGNWILNKRNGTANNEEWQFIFYLNRFSFSKFHNGSTAIYQEISSSTGVFPLSTWVHICYTDNGSGLVGSGKMYINGVLNTSINQNVGAYTKMLAGNSVTRIGQAGFSTSGNLHHYGKVDELAIWKNRELSASEVLELYNKGNSGLTII